MTADGRFVVFSSTGNNLVTNQNGNPFAAQFPATLNVYLRDRSTGTTTLVSVGQIGQNAGNGDSLPDGISADGRYVLFESDANNLVAGDTNNCRDIFVRDMVSQTTLLVSVGTNGTFGNGDSRDAVITPDGRYVAFASAANNLVAGDTNKLTDVFVRDLQGATTTLASVGALAPSTSYTVYGSDSPLLSVDGRYVAFFSTATNLVPGADSTAGAIFIRDAVAETTILASSGALAAVQAAFGATNVVSFSHVLSADGLHLAYEAGCFPRGYPSSAGVVLRYDLFSDSTELVHSNAAISYSAFNEIRSLDMTPDGRFIAFVANATGDRNTNTCTFVWDANSGSNVLVSADLNGQVPPGSICAWPALDGTGRYVCFLSTATNLVTNSLSGLYHFYSRDLQNGTTILVDADSNGVGAGLSPTSLPRVTADGQQIVFDAPDSSLVPVDNNHASDVFLRDLSASSTELISSRHASLPSSSPNGHSTVSVTPLSTDGRLATFASEADNLAEGVTNDRSHIYLRDVVAGTNLLVSLNTNGLAADGSSYEPNISLDGRYIVFTSMADDLVAGDFNHVSDVFLYNLQAGTINLVSISSTPPNPGNGASRSARISSDGRYVYFLSRASNLAAGTFSTGSENLFMRDLNLGRTYPITTGGASGFSMTPDGRYAVVNGAVGSTSAKLYVWSAASAAILFTNAVFAGPGPSIDPTGTSVAYTTTALYLWWPTSNSNRLIASQIPSKHQGLRFSSDGRFLAYVTAQAMVPADNNFNYDVYCYDTQNSSNFLISTTYSGTSPNGRSDNPDISPDGRFVAYCSGAGDIVPGDTNGMTDVFLYDRQNAVTMLVSLSRFANQTADNFSTGPMFSPDGRTLLFRSWASDITAGDFNATQDIYTINLYPDSTVPVFLINISRDPVTPQACWLTWPVVPGKTYQVQVKNSLSDPAWQEPAGAAVIVGNQGYFRDLVTGSSQRFYRVVAL